MTDIRNDDDLERLLRSTLTVAADTVTSGPTLSPDQGDEVLSGTARRRWLAPVAAAAAAAVVAGIVVASRQQHDDNAPPSTSTPSMTSTAPTSTPTPTPTRRNVDITRAVCSVPMPAEWATAMTEGTTTADSDSVLPLATFPDGRVVVSRDLGTIRDVALLGADGHAESIYTVTSYSEQVYSAQVEGNTVLIEVSKLVRRGGTTVPTIADLVIVDPGLGQIEIADGRHGTIDGGAMLDGHVYFDLRPNPDSEHGTIYDADLATYLREGREAVFTGDVSGPKLFGGGISWAPRSYRIGVPRTVPAPVAKETRTQPANRDPAVTDGTSWAWEDNADGIAWYRNGQPGPVHVRVGSDAAVYAVTGNYVLYQIGDLKPRLLDVRTGAAVVLPGIAPTITSGNGVVGVAVPTGAAKNSPTKVLRLDTRKLPGLTC